VSEDEKPLMILAGEIRTPPMGQEVRRRAGFYLRLPQKGESLAMPISRPMPVIGPRCHELRIDDENTTWRILYRTDPDAILILDVFSKRTRTTPRNVISSCKRRIRLYDSE
jgi:phage-related protein